MQYSKQFPEEMFKNVIDKYNASQSKLLLLDYDGTLVDFESFPERAKPSDQLLLILRKLLSMPQTEVIIISGRKYTELDEFLGDLPIDLIAEHGTMIKKRGVWYLQSEITDSWKYSVLNLLNSLTKTCPNSFVEEKQSSLAWHYRNADPQSSYLHSRMLLTVLHQNINTEHLRILNSKNVIEVTQATMDKGKAVKKLLESKNYDYVLCIGDDLTDEDMFYILELFENAFTIKVGEGKTIAKLSMNSYKDVLMLLEQLAK